MCIHANLWSAAGSKKRWQRACAKQNKREMVKGFLKPSAGAGTTQKILQDHPDDSSFEDSMVRKKGGSGLAQSKTKEKIRIPLEIWKHTLHTYTYTHRFSWTHTHIHIHIYTHTHIHEKFLFHVRQAESKWNDDVINQTPISHVPSSEASVPARPSTSQHPPLSVQPQPKETPSTH